VLILAEVFVYVFGAESSVSSWLKKREISLSLKFPTFETLHSTILGKALCSILRFLSDKENINSESDYIENVSPHPEGSELIGG